MAPPSPGRFIDLPNDILLELFQSLTLRDRMALRRTCKRLHALHDAAPSLMYKLALEADGLVDVPQPLRQWGAEGVTAIELNLEVSRAPLDMVPWETNSAPSSVTPPTTTMIMTAPVPSVKAEASEQPLQPAPDKTTTLTSSQRLELLRDTNARWRTLSPSSTSLMHYDLQYQHLHHLVGGALVVLPTYHRRCYPTIVIPLPCNPDDELPREAARQVVADAVDIGQDLAVVIESERVRLLSIATGEPHPSAACSELDLSDLRPVPDAPSPTSTEFSDDDEIDSRVDVLGSTLLIPTETDDEDVVEFVAWNWRAGQRLGGRLQLNGTAAWNAYLLTPTTVLVAYPPPEWIRVGEEVRRQTPGADIQLYSFAAEGDTLVDPFARLKLPQLAPNVYLYPKWQRNFLQPGRCADDGASRLPSSLPFEHSWRHGVLRLGCTMQNDGEGRVEWEIYILRERLVAIAEECEARLAITKSPHRTYEWEEWGGRFARVLLSPPMNKVHRSDIEDDPDAEGCVWLSNPARYASFAGYRDAYVLWRRELPLLKKYAENYDLVVRDFSPAAVARAQKARSAAGVAGCTAFVTQREGYDVTVRVFDGERVIKAGGTGGKLDNDMRHGDGQDGADQGCEPIGDAGAWAWLEDVRSALPYVETRRPIGRLPGPIATDDQPGYDTTSHTLLIDSQRVVITSRPWRGDSLQVLVFNL